VVYCAGWVSAAGAVDPGRLWIGGPIVPLSKSEAVMLVTGLYTLAATLLTMWLAGRWRKDK
jgi:hypothetical protein